MVGKIGGNDNNYALFQDKTIDELKFIVVKAMKDTVTVS